MIAIDEVNVRRAIKTHDALIKKAIKNAKKGLGFLIKNRAYTGNELKYIKKLHSNVKNIVVAPTNELENYKKVFDKVLKASSFSNGFKDEIVKTLGYVNLRSILPKYFKTLGIKACVYCNAQYALSVGKKRTTKGKFQVDHSIPQALYPCFSISLYNLFPVCGSCNISKGKKDCSFKLYTTDKSKTLSTEYEFKLKRGCVAKYLLTNPYNIDKLDFKFIDTDKTSTSKNSLQDLFYIKETYETQKDIIEELIFKAKVYKASYKNRLVNSFPQLLTNASLANRILIGNYTKPEEIHKRPMAKFTQDIAKQLGLIAKI